MTVHILPIFFCHNTYICRMARIRISAVSYLNSKPFIYGLEQAEIIKEIELSIDTPALCAKKLLLNEADIGLVPVAILPQLKNCTIIGDYCIGAIGAVSSVKLYSMVPLNSIESILLDYQSYTSVALTRILAKHYWYINPTWIEAAEGYEQKIESKTAGVVIGDRTFDLNNKFKYQYDLSEEWHKFTGLPFVFACWISTKGLSPIFAEAFNNALAKGVTSIDILAKEIERSEKYKIDVYKYFDKSISYTFDDEKHKGLNLFLNYLSQQ